MTPHLALDGSGYPINDTGANNIFFQNPQGFVSGEAVVYDWGGGAGIGLSTGAIYYVIKVDNNVIKLAATSCRRCRPAGDPGTLSGRPAGRQPAPSRPGSAPGDAAQPDAGQEPRLDSASTRR